MKKGIDISYHQGDVDFALLKSSGIEFIIIREGYRNTTDKKFFEYVRMAREAGIIILAVYHFSYALNEEQAKNEGRFCVENMHKAGLGSDVMVFFDFEYDTVKKAANQGVLLNAPECNRHAVAFCEEVYTLGFTPGIYTNIDYYKNWYDQRVLDKYRVWLADYTGEPNYPCLIQQYSSKGQLPGIKGNVDLNYFYGKFKMGDENKRLRSEVVNLAASWVGKNEADGSYKGIIDIYNSYPGPFPRGVKMQYDWAWCACTWSTLAIALGYTDIMPIEISCGELIKQAQKMGCWEERDGFIPRPGDAILYDWGDNGSGDNVGWPDHVGVVEKVDGVSITVIEGNCDDMVKRRTISIDGKCIRGFITPKYTEEEEDDTSIVLTTCCPRNVDVSFHGDYITTGNLYCRNDAGTSNKALCVIPKDTNVKCYGFYTEYNGVPWPLIHFKLNGVEYTGFSSSRYLSKKNS